MKNTILSAVAVAFSITAATAQYAPQAGISGSTAIISTSPDITGWATGCTVVRGLMDIAQPSLGQVSSGNDIMAIGAADYSVVSLGDSGVAVLTFAHPIINGTGPDFAVFENGFPDPVDAEKAFLELAFVEVSSDGINFIRFPAASETQSEIQVAGAGIYLDARTVNNLAGKYRSNYGTPFDLQELDGIPGLNINNITHIRLVDVIGSVDGYSSFDANNKIINDPYPTPWPIGGFDLDAVAVLNQGINSAIPGSSMPGVAVYPNPVSDQLTITTPEPLQAFLSDITGKVVWQETISGNVALDMTDYSSGLYILSFTSTKGDKWVERITKQ